MQTWTKAQVGFLQKNYPKFGGRFCAEQLRRSYFSINRKAQKLHLSICRNPSSKICSICKTEKPTAQFHQRSRLHCLSCYNMQRNQYYTQHKNSWNQHRINNKQAFWKQRNAYQRHKRQTDARFHLRHSLGHRIYLALKANRISKTNSFNHLIGCSGQELKLHLQSKFKTDMTWDNYGKWHVDHIRPCSSFDLSRPEEQKKCFHYTNLQPLWAQDNLKKGAKWLSTAQ